MKLRQKWEWRYRVVYVGRDGRGMKLKQKWEWRYRVVYDDESGYCIDNIREKNHADFIAATIAEPTHVTRYREYTYWIPE